ncbi:HAD family hydrolase [Halalkalicoccus jeotgali]|uniref:HAD superfamily hydrolase n=1 Tax=Halalkalicoccus jeotgali (strain DSM 18796 / CECT 7217 / JCM 14584 / KCTC 4019 / B3) TaxID=795797 RepID=D8JA62_HALJB|nr:HAD-IA family hydrolase [Halalkalicoccus jeotgali]ADJ14584.1 HAD-superfamily hydrolase, subfamily IA, variant 1 [Halalkalicoccus jeotgali B3]ELY39956.1 HAD superfamily hydrolase [Halalkalicoccus jeotgali B3]
MSEYDAVVFDNDGVLVERTRRDVLHGAIRETYEEFGVSPAEAEVEALLGVTRESVDELATEYGLDTAEFWYRRDMLASRAQCESIENGGKPLYEDIGALDELSPTLGVVSNNQHRTIEFILEHYDLHHHFETHYGREPTLAGIERKKPSAYYIERALTDLDTRNALYVGDSGVDVLAAREAGLDCAFIRRPHREDYDLPAAPAYEIRSLADLPVICRGDGEAFRPDMESAT